MSNIPNQRKTYMMLSKENNEKFIVEPDTHKIVKVFPDKYVSKYKTLKDDGHGNEEVEIKEVENACYYYKFPEAFINSKNKRWVEIHHCKVFVKGSPGGEFILHSDIVQRDAYLDHAVMNVNETRTKYKKYEYTQQEKYFKIWFTSFAEKDQEVKDEDISFMCEMMLIY